MNALGVWGQFFSMAILGLVLWAAVSVSYTHLTLPTKA